MVSLPFLFPIYAPYFGDAYRGWVALAMGVAAMATLSAPAIRGQSGSRVAVAFPRVACVVPIGLAGLLALQIITGRALYVEANLFAILYLLWMLGLMAAVATLRQRLGVSDLVDHMALAVLGGAGLCAAFGLLSYFGYGGSWLASIRSAAAFGTLGQANHFAHYLWLGVASLLHLHARGRLRRIPAAMLLLLLLFASSLSGSRSSFLYAALMPLAALWSGRQEKNWAFWTAGAYALLAWVVPQIVPVPAVSVWTRLQGDAAFLLPGADSGQNVRATLLGVAWQAFLSAPWLGVGLGGFRWASFATADRSEGWKGAGEHAHNLFANLLAELGVFAPLIVGIALIVWMWRLAPRRSAPEGQWVAAMAGIALIHAQLEYPFWYPALLGVFAVVVAIGDDAMTLRWRRSTLLLGLVVGAALLTSYGVDLVRLEALARRPAAQVITVEALVPRLKGIAELRRGSLLAPQIDAVLTAIVPPTNDNLDDRVTLCRKSMAYLPAYPNVFTCSLLYGLDGRKEEARRLWQLGGVAFPGRAAEYEKAIKESLTSEELAPILDMLDHGSGGKT